MTAPMPYGLLAVILAAVTITNLILGGAVGYVFGHRHGLEDDPRLADLPPVPLGDMPPLAPLDPADPVDALILEARMYEP